MRAWKPEYQAAQRIARRQRYATDPEYRERVLAASREDRRWRYRNDPEYRQRRIAQASAYYHSKRERP